MAFLTNIFSIDGAALALRIALAAIFLIHGYPKLKNLKNTAEFVAGLGFKPGIFWGFMLAVSEFFGGIAMLVGLFSHIASGLLIISMLVATYLKIVKWKVPFSKPDGEPGWEFDLIILAGLIALFMLGSGAWSLDAILTPYF